MIKNICIFLFSLLTTLTFGQLVQTENSTHEHDNKQVSVYRIILDVDKDDVKEYWNDFMEDENDKKIKGYGFFSKKDLLETEMTTISSISNEPLKLFMHFDETDGKTRLSLFAEKENGEFLDPNQRKDLLSFNNMKRLGNRYLEYFLPAYYRETMRNAEENLEDLNKDLEKVNEDISDKEKEIEELREEIEEAKKEKAELETATAKARKVLERKKYSYSEIKSIMEQLSPK